jgi:NAD(P)-dependent dehydrogenase (short-subunit alcohol dehydrogenase family)
MKDFQGKVAAVTGAGSGIGRALAVELAGRGAALALCDVDTAGLAQTVAQCESRGAKVSARPLDVSKRAEVYAWADAVAEEFGTVNLVVNNAGVALGTSIESMQWHDFEWLMGVNFWGVTYGTKAFLPHLIASGDGHVVNVSSVFGLISVPTQSAYNAAKFAVRGFTDALRMELEMAGHPVSATTVHPGGIKTNIVRNGRVDPTIGEAATDKDKAHRDFQKMARTTPEQAARTILGAVRANKRRVLVGPDAYAIDLISRLPAGLYQRVLKAGAKRRLRS